jgi:hypothetical protein
MPHADQLTRAKHAPVGRGRKGQRGEADSRRQAAAAAAAWLRSHRLAGAIAAVVVVACVVAAVLIAGGGGGGSSPARQAALKAESRLNATRLAGKLPPTGPSAGELAARTKGSGWFAGSGGRRLAAVNADVGALNKAAVAGNQAAVRRAGTELAQAARAALNGKMPPVDAGSYVAALDGFERAGNDAAAGAVAAAQSAENVSELYIAKVTSALDEPSKKQPPGS